MPRSKRRPSPAPMVKGRLEVHRHGFGFVRPEEDGGRDIYVRSDRLSGALHGDRVAVRVTAKKSDGRREGIVVRVLERALQRVSGLFRSAGPAGIVEPYDGRLVLDIRIPPAGVGGARDGEVVGCELSRISLARRRAEGRIVEILGCPEEREIDYQVVSWKYGLRRDFPEEVLIEAESCPGEIPDSELRGREDFRGLPTITIDPSTARDHDDAVSLQRSGNSRYRIGVHIADVAHFVPEGSEIDREAYRRGTSVYFPGKCLPMLPDRLSGDLCSLRADRDRLTLSVILEMDPRVGVVDSRITHGIIRSRSRMTYTEVADLLKNGDRDSHREGPPRQFFLDLERSARLLQEGRRSRGSIDFDLPEPEIVLDERGETTGIIPLERNPAHSIIEEFMLAANEVVARKLFSSRIPSLYRVHERPDPAKLETLNEILEGFGFNLPGPYENIPSRVFQDLLERIRGRPEDRFLAQLILRSMKQARYSDEPRGHFGLAMRLYTHFTSPIRRFPDLQVHRLLKRLLGGARIGPEERTRLRGRVPEVARECSRTERTAEAAERELMDWKKAAFMGDRVGEEFSGFISGVARFGFFVELEDVFVEGLVPLTTLQDDRYRFWERKHILRGERRGRVFRLGSRVRVRVDRVGAWPPRIDFSLVEGCTVASRGVRRARA